MEKIAEYQRRAFLKEHPPVLEQIILASTGTEQTLLAGSVIGAKTTTDDSTTTVTNELFAAGMEPVGILAEDVTVPEEGDARGLIYVHCACLASGLIWADGIAATAQDAAIAAMRKIGIFAGA